MGALQRNAVALPGGRVLIAELDSQAQVRLLSSSGSGGQADARDGMRMLTEVLRVGASVAETVLLTDAMVFDSSYFLALGPDGLIRELGTSSADVPVVVTGIDATLGDALERRLDTPDHAWAIAGGATNREWAPPEAVKRGWQSWVSATERGLIRYERQAPSDTPMRFGEVGELSVAGSTLVPQLRAETRRSVVEHVLATTADLTRSDIRTLRDWWGNAYLRLIAENAGASWISFAGSRATRLEERVGAVSLRLPEQLIMWARRTTPAEFAAGRRATDALREALRKRPTGLRLRALSYIATARTPRPRRARVVVESAGRIVVAACLILIALPFIPILAADGPLAWLVFAVIALGTFPLRAFLDLFVVLVPEPTAIFVVHPVEVDR